MRAQDPDQVPQLVQGLAAGDPQVLGRLPGRLVGGGHPQCPGLQHLQADVVRHHVVHLAGQPGPFLGPGLLGEQVTLPLGPVGPLPQRLQQGVAGPPRRAGIMAARADWRECGTGLAVAVVGAVAVAAGPAGAWAVADVGLCAVLLGRAVITWRQRA